ncbi:High mobility group B protein 7 [Forsythia ovata]|uniref:High mobility group B protein 7 n=1 Tax=Forsythia ovata TaxID=205694 RepID=A0ABD1PJI7_9LAMI
MAGSGAPKSSNPPRGRKRVEADSSTSSATNTLKRAKDGSAFAKCNDCNKDVPVALIGFHDCSLNAKIRMHLGSEDVEMPIAVKKNPAEKKKAKSTEPKAKKEKKAKNPNAPKRPPTAFFLFLDDFRKTYKAANPNCKSVSEVAKEGGEKWKSMTIEEKKLYADRAAELKAEYLKVLKSNEEENEQDEDDATEKEAKEEVEVDDE